jgi:hypothetical protein
VTAPRGSHAASDGSFGRSAGNAAARGGLLVIVAVLIGLFLLRQGLDDEGALVKVDTGDSTTESSIDPGDDGAAAGGATDDATGDTATAPSSSTSTTLLPARPNEEIKIRVANATTDGAGLAGDAVNFLIAQGFNALAPKNAIGEPIQASTVYYLPGWESEAVAVAQAFGVDASVVTIFTDTTADLVESMDDATILVILGDDGVIRAR